jgi:CO dehydrogenase maturation factor
MIIAVVGKGGVGKTTVAALLLRRLLDSAQTPVLAIDADPSSCLGSALGIAATRTLGEARDVLREGGDRPASMSQAEYFALQAEDAMAEREGFDLLTMGHPEGKGCYCFVNNLIRDHLDRLARGYRHVLLDCEAGLEHLSRRTAGRPGAMICVANRSRMAAETVRRALTLYRSLHRELPLRVDLVLNGFSDGDPRAAEATALACPEGARFHRVFLLPEDPEVRSRESAGRSLLELAPDGPAASALRDWGLRP